MTLRMSLLAVGAAVVFSMAAAVPAAMPATAAGLGEQSCTPLAGPGNLCILASRGAADQVLVHIGIDLAMSQATAQQIIDLPGEEFTVVLFGADTPPGNPDDTLAVVPMSWDSAWSGGLSAEFDVFVDRSVLDEDSGQDEVYAVVVLRGTTTRTFLTDQIRTEF
jgi:hypothetical protein